MMSVYRLYVYTLSHPHRPYSDPRPFLIIFIIQSIATLILVVVVDIDSVMVVGVVLRLLFGPWY